MYTTATGKRATPANPSFAGKIDILYPKYIPIKTAPKMRTKM